MCVEVVWSREGNGGLIREETSKIQCERCEVEKKAINGMVDNMKKNVE